MFLRNANDKGHPGEMTSHFQIEVGSERGFGIVFGVVFAIVAVWPLVFGGGGIRFWALAIAAVFGVVAFVRPGLLRPLNRMWFKFGILLGKIVAPLVMMLVFFVAVTPTALIARLLGKDSLRLRPSHKEAQSAWIERPEQEQTIRMKNQF